MAVVCRSTRAPQEDIEWVVYVVRGVRAVLQELLRERDWGRADGDGRVGVEREDAVASDHVDDHRALPVDKMARHLVEVLQRDPCQQVDVTAG